MSLGQLSSRGKQNNKLYLIKCTGDVGDKSFTFYFYSSRIISNKTQLIEYLLSRNNNHSIGVFGNNYVFQSNDFCVLSSIKADPVNNNIYLYYYINDENGWRASTLGTISFQYFEM